MPVRVQALVPAMHGKPRDGWKTRSARPENKMARAQPPRPHVGRMQRAVEASITGLSAEYLWVRGVGRAGARQQRRRLRLREVIQLWVARAKKENSADNAQSTHMSSGQGRLRTARLGSKQGAALCFCFFCISSLFFCVMVGGWKREDCGRKGLRDSKRKNVYFADENAQEDKNQTQIEQKP